MVLIILMYAIFASSFPLTKILLTYTTPFFLTGTRMLIAGALLIFYHTWYRKKSCRIQKNQLWLYVQIIVIGIYLNYVVRFWAIHYLTSIKASFIFSFSPLTASLLSYICLKEKMTGRQWLGFGCGFAALIPILITSSPAESFMGEFWYVSWPELAMLLSVVADSYKWVLMRKLIVQHTCSPLVINGLCMACGGSLALMTSLPLEGLFPVTSIMPFFALLMVYVLISNVISYNLYGHLLRIYTATFLSLAGFMVPIFSSFYGWILLNEHVSWHFYISLVILMIGLYLFYKGERNKKTCRSLLCIRK